MHITQRLTIALLPILFYTSATAQNRNITGYVVDAQSGEPLLYANCVESVSGSGVSTNGFGFFSLPLRGDSCCIHVSCLGYQISQNSYKVSSDTLVTISVMPKVTSLSEVTVSSYVPLRQQTGMGKATVPMQLIQSMPSFVGEADLMKAITFLPGVAAGRDGYSHVYVRGGDRGQNLMLIDGIKVYNSSHAGGFVSQFNADALKHVDVYKGGFPARYGGRASSVIDVYTRDGNSQRPSGKISVGLVSSSLLYEMPVGERTTFFVAGRSSYYDLFTRGARQAVKSGKTGDHFGYTFYDINAKIKHRLSDANTIMLSFFHGNDIMRSGEHFEYTNAHTERDNRMVMRNTGLSFTHTMSGDIFFWRNTISASEYANISEYKQSLRQYAENYSEEEKAESRIRDLTAQSRMEITTGINVARFGVEASAYNFNPGMMHRYYNDKTVQAVTDTVVGVVSDINSQELNLYAEDEIQLGRFALNAGLRATYYHCPDADYTRLEPRASMRLSLCDALSFKANYSVMNQFNHVLVNNEEGTEREVWLAATDKLKPQHAEQVSAGFFYGNEERKADLSVEAFYKKMSNLVEYLCVTETHESINDIEKRTTAGGIGRSYGIEVQATKAFDKVKATVGYTLSWSDRKFDTLNNGEWFPFIYDKRHDLSLMVQWQINDLYSLSGNFAFASGMPVTLPVAYSAFDDNFESYYIYNGINNRRMPAYHRLDLSAVRKMRIKKVNAQIAVNIFNVYARQNATGIYYKNETDDNGNVNFKVMQSSLFSIIPTMSITVQI